MKIFSRAHSGFTLVDLMLTMSIIAILLGVIFFMVDPGGRILDANQAKATQDAREMEKAITLYMAELDEDPGDGIILPGYENRKHICNYGLNPSEVGTGPGQVNCIVLDELVDEGFLPTLPRHFMWQEDVDERVLGYTAYKQGRQVIIGDPLIPHAVYFGSPTSLMSVAPADVMPFDTNTPFSVVIWMQPLDTSGAGPLLQKMNAGQTRGFRIFRNGQGMVALMLSNLVNYLTMSHGNIFEVQTAMPYRMLTLMYDGSGTPTGFSMYYNDGYNGSSLGPGIGVNPIAVDDPLLVGGNGSQSFQGLVDDMKIYNRILTPEEITSLFTSSNQVLTGLKHHWKFDEGKGSVAYDAVTGKPSALVDTEWSNDTYLAP